MTLAKIITVVVAGGLLLIGGPARAGSLSELIPNLFGRDGIDLLPAAGLACCPGSGHQPHFEVEAQRELTTLNDALRGQLGSFPLPSPASGFTFQFDPALGVFTRSTDSFGPIFAERADTIGRRKFSVGFTYSRFTFDKLDGKDLHNGELALTFLHDPTAEINRQTGTGAQRPDPFAFEADTITAQIFADITTDLFVFSATYGVLDNLDVGIAIPIVRTAIDARGVAQINRVGTPGDPVTHRFDPTGADTIEVRASDESTGLGDILLRAKYNFYRQKPVALAAALDLRLPTGDEKELRGLDTVRVRPFFIASANVFGVAPHVNLGFDLGDTSKLENEFFYNLGFDWAVVKPVTVAFDLLGRYILDNDRPKAGRPAGSQETADNNIVNAAIGLKVNPWRNVLLLFNLLIALNGTGLRDDITPLVGIEVSF